MSNLVRRRLQEMFELEAAKPMRRRVNPSWPSLTAAVGSLPLFLIILLVSQIPADAGSNKSPEARDLKESKRQNVISECLSTLYGAAMASFLIFCVGFPENSQLHAFCACTIHRILVHEYARMRMNVAMVLFTKTVHCTAFLHLFHVSSVHDSAAGMCQSQGGHFLPFRLHGKPPQATAKRGSKQLLHCRVYKDLTCCGPENADAALVALKYEALQCGSQAIKIHMLLIIHKATFTGACPQLK